MKAYLFTTLFNKQFKPAVGTYCSGKKIPFIILLLTDDAPSHARALMEIYNETNVVFTSVNIVAILQPIMDKKSFQLSIPII